MSPQTDGLADLAREVVSQLTASLEADDTRRPWLRAWLGHGKQPMFLGIQHHGGHAVWVVKHNADKEIRFPIAKEREATCLFVNGVLSNKMRDAPMVGPTKFAIIELVHCDHVLMATSIVAGTRSFDETEQCFDSMVAILKSAI